ncbi:uncharacterized protein LOC114383786 [Glycine soja]|uniref:uncharacterized protein n=1 Tax=Glycine max TaxID=3847 RepID=UPI000E21BAFC|nr:uncharacterized protein LOC106795778 [Glycine max]XP_028199326.1 uncharacterized protein LOC114383786 [Glycine soja]|eukprot:XP_025981162.1 uncharacterized protein LOC106795778 [Glycine max]
MSFLGHAGFYRRFIKDFSKIAKPMSNLLNKDVVFLFDEDCLKAFNTLKTSLVSAPGSENLVAAHLSRLVNEEVTLKELEIRDDFPDELSLVVNERPWFADLANFKATGIHPKDLNWQQKKKFLHDARFYVWDDPHLFKIGADNLLRRCVTREESKSILWHFRNSPCGRHYSGDETTTKVLQSGFFWSSVFSDAHEHATKCDQCQRMGNISRRNDCWGIEFVGPLPPSYGNEYIIVAVDYVSKWVEAVASLKNDAKIVPTSKGVGALQRHTQGGFTVPSKTNGQAEVSNRELKKILE